LECKLKTAPAFHQTVKGLKELLFLDFKGFHDGGFEIIFFLGHSSFLPSNSNGFDLLGTVTFGSVVEEVRMFFLELDSSDCAPACQDKARL
jgi:hypothetical protein